MIRNQTASYRNKHSLLLYHCIMKRAAISFGNYQEAMLQVNIKKLPEILRQGHQFILEAQAFYHEEPTIKDTIDLYLERLNAYLLKNGENEKTPVSVMELDFISRFLEIHKTIQSKEQLKAYIVALQKAIAEKEISKNSEAAIHIEQIQHKLILQYNKLALKEQVQIIINKKWLAVLQKLTKNNNAISDGLGGTVCAATNSSRQRNTLFSAINKQTGLQLKNTFQLPGNLGQLLGDLEKFELAITIEGDQGGGKTRFTYQLADAFASIGNDIAIFSLEIGSSSNLITRMKEEYLQPKNQERIFISGQLPDGYKTIEETAKQFDVIIIDSWNKTGLLSQEFDRLRKENPNTIFIVIFQRTTQKTIRGGTAPLFDAGINIEIVKADDSFVNNYAVTTKNRYGITGIKYNIYNRELMEGTKNDWDQKESKTEITV